MNSDFLTAHCYPFSGCSKLATINVTDLVSFNDISSLKYLTDGEYGAAKETALKYRDIFGKDNYFIEIQNHGIKEEVKNLPLLYKLSAETGIPLIATNDCHYINKKDSEMQNVLICIQTGKTLDDPNALKFETDEFYVKSADEMAELFKGHEEAVTNTCIIAERCNVDFEFGNIKLPKFTIDGVDDNKQFFRELAEKVCLKNMVRSLRQQLRNVLNTSLTLLQKWAIPTTIL